jgi:hypothetical protein
MHCTRCEGTGFLNLHQVGQHALSLFVDSGDPQIILRWIDANTDHDVTVCDCCGDGEQWYGEPGQHDSNNPHDPMGCR